LKKLKKFYDYLFELLNLVCIDDIRWWHTHTYTFCFNSHFPSDPGLASSTIDPQSPYPKHPHTCVKFLEACHSAISVKASKAQKMHCEREFNL